jgi:hypothetical protein
VASIGVGAPSNTYANPPANFALLNTPALVQTAIQPKAGGNLTPTVLTTCNAGGPALYTAGAGLYFDYVNRISTAPF